jgi:ElaA protein
MSIAPAVDWDWRDFDALAPHQLYAVLRLRSEVFVLEQSCLFQDMDGHDAAARHLMGRRDDRLAAYARCLPPGVTFAEASIGRIVTDPSERGSGLGHELVRRAIGLVEQSWGRQPIRIGAQAHLARFYAAHGFQDLGRPYVEDGIDHLEMLRPAT